MFNKPGYYVVAETWENDADNHKVTTLFVPREKVKDVVECALMFRSSVSCKIYDSEDNIRLGNHETASYDDSEDDPVVQIIKHIEDKIGVDLMDDFEYDLIGTWDDGSFYRVVDNVSVIYVDKPHEDVTAQFITETDEGYNMSNYIAFGDDDSPTGNFTIEQIEDAIDFSACNECGLDEAFGDNYIAESIVKDMIRFMREKEII
jgi:hypothetical protein